MLPIKDRLKAYNPALENLSSRLHYDEILKTLESNQNFDEAMPKKEDEEEEKRRDSGEERERAWEGASWTPFSFSMDFRRMERMLNDMMKDMFEAFPFNKTRKSGRYRPHVYGFSINIGPNGVPKIRRFGDIQSSRGGTPKIRERREPLVDVMEHEDEIEMIAELPGVDKGDIDLRIVRGREVLIEVDTQQRRYRRKIRLPADVQGNPKATYKNGVLTVQFKKEKGREAGDRIGIE